MLSESWEAEFTLIVADTRRCIQQSLKNDESLCECFSVPLLPINEHLWINLLATDNFLHDSSLLHTCPSIWLIPVFPSGTTERVILTEIMSSSRTVGETQSYHRRCCSPQTFTRDRLSFNSWKNRSFIATVASKCHNWANSAVAEPQKRWEIWTSRWFLGTGTLRRRWTHPYGLKLMCPPPPMRVPLHQCHYL